MSAVRARRPLCLGCTSIHQTASDPLLPPTAGDEAIARHTLNEVNWRRGAWARLNRPLVVWLPKEALRRLARNAPDFFDWNSGVYVARPPADDEE